MSKRPPIDDMRQHVADLLEEHEIQYRLRARGAYALLEAWEVQFPPIKSDISYGVALHEIGHLLGRFQTSPSTMVRERWAWRWAKRNAVVWTARMAKEQDECLAWYAPRARSIDVPKYD